MTRGISLERSANHFDLIRLVMAILVVIAHAFVLSGHQDHPLIKLFQTTNPADASFRVNMFFVISGFFVTHSLYHSTSYKNYFWRRVLRIYPALATVILLSMFVIGPAFTTLSLKQYFTELMLWDYLRSFSLFSMRYFLPGLFENNPFPGINGSLWVLRYEFTAYIALFLLSLTGLLQRKIVVVTLFILCIIISIAQIIPHSLVLLSLNIQLTLKLAIYFLAGIIIYLFREHIPLNFTFALFALVLSIAPYFFNSLDFVYFLTLPYLLVYIAFIPSPFYFSANKYGDYSMGLFIYSFPVMESLIYIFNNKVNIYIFSFLSILISFVLAYFSWHYIEQKALNYKNVVK